MNKLSKILVIFLMFFLGSLSELIRLNNSFAAEKEKISIDYLDFKPKTEYILGPGDIIYISILEEDPQLNLNSFINIDGTIILPEIDRIYVEGLTIYELEQLLDEKYKSLLRERNPQISLVRPRDIKIYIKGEVESPGLYVFQSSQPIENQNDPKKEDLATSPFTINYQLNQKNYYPNHSLSFAPTLFDVIKKSGGITRYSNLQDVEVIRFNSLSNGGGKIKTNLNLLSALINGDTDQNIKLQDKDVISIKKTTENIDYQIANAMRSNLNPKFIDVYLTGRVLRPGPYKLKRNSDLNSVILAGGSKFLKGAITLYRYENNGELSRKRIKYGRNAKSGSKNNPYINDGDIINVGDAPFSIATDIIKEITSPFVGIYSTIKVFNMDWICNKKYRKFWIIIKY